jgi:hypothetical protein
VGVIPTPIRNRLGARGEGADGGDGPEMEGGRGLQGVGGRRPTGRDTPLIRLWLCIRRLQLLLRQGLRSLGS